MVVGAETKMAGAPKRRSGGAVFGLFAAALCLITAGPALGKDGVLNVRFGGDQNETRVVIELDKAAKGRVIEDGRGDKALTLALSDVGTAADLQGHGQGLVAAWTAQESLGDARLKLQLTRPVVVKRRFLLPPSDGVAVYRYVIDLQSVDASAPAPAGSPRSSGAPVLVTPVSNVAPPLHLKKVIVIDAGHGGHDPGAAGAWSREKDINLAAARALKAALEKSGRYKIVMTRDSDTYVPLETRVQIARHADADLFISLHSDSGPDATVHGATVYTLSDKGSDRVVRNVMAENDWFINVDMPGRDKSVNQILLDLTQRATRNRSAAFAENLLDHIGGGVQLVQRSHRDANFVVLLAPDVPAVLLEMGFITNPEDEKLLNDPAKRGRFMGAVARSIDDYFGQQTRIAAR
ncbi:MAG TPA: N-acetylmuramoyl-L-alanine amidase [Caulobacteraceae bacterium]|jgi:N-acetylmuramoyl-L-alanine amidase|nr:N-acetylmuramoyl-L-alanine amidase [Caulobacteraceae bacterium]